MSACDTPLSLLADRVQERLEEPVGDPGIFWRRQAEVYTAIVEAMNDLILLVGRPTQMASFPFNLAPNSVWQSFSGYDFGGGFFGGGGFGGGSALFYLITDIQGPQSALWKVNLHDMDYVQASWGSDWENDVAENPLRWFPVGLNMFGIHPAVSTPTQVLLTGILCPVTEIWPYQGDEVVPFHHEFFVALEEYAAHYCRIKEAGAEFEESLSLYQSYLGLAERMSQLEDRRDPLIFNKSVGGPTGLNPIKKR